MPQPMLARVHHSEPLVEELPQRWKRYWRAALSRQARAVYTALRREMFDGQLVDLRLLATELLMTPNAVMTALRELEGHGFVAVDQGLD